MSHAKWVGAVGFAALALVGCANEDGITPSEPVASEAGPSGSTSQADDLWSIVDRSRSTLTDRQQESLSLVESPDYVVETNFVELVADTASLVEGQAIGIPVSPTGRYVVVLEQVERYVFEDDPPGGIMLSGSVQDGSGTFQFSMDDQGRAFGNLHSDPDAFDITYLGDGLYVVIRIDPTKLGPVDNEMAFHHCRGRSVDSVQSVRVQSVSLLQIRKGVRGRSLFRK